MDERKEKSCEVALWALGVNEQRHLLPPTAAAAAAQCGSVTITMHGFPGGLSEKVRHFAWRPEANYCLGRSTLIMPQSSGDYKRLEYRNLLKEEPEERGCSEVGEDDDEDEEDDDDDDDDDDDERGCSPNWSTSDHVTRRAQSLAGCTTICLGLTRSVMMSALGGVADHAMVMMSAVTTGLPYLGSNDAVYDDPSVFSGLMKSGFHLEKPPFPGVKEPAYNDDNHNHINHGLAATALYPAAANLSDLLQGNGTSVRRAAGELCGENFADHMECFMILTPSQQLAIAILALTLGSFTVLENLVVLCVILHSRTLRSRPSYHFIGSLAVADLIGSIIFVYSFLDFHVLHRKDTPDVFLFKLAGVIASFTASVGSLFLTAIDRYVSIHRPMAYKRIVTKAKAVAAFSAMWAVSIAFSLLPLLGWNCRNLNSVCSDIFPLIDRRYLMFWMGMTSALVLFIVYAYVFILWKAHRHAVRMVGRSSQRSVIVYTADGTKVQMARPEQTRVDLRLAKTLVLILVALIICWGPVLAIMAYDLFWKVSDAVKAVFAFCSMLCLLNSTANPVIYALRSKDLRRAFLNLCRVSPSAARWSQSLEDGGKSDCCCGLRGTAAAAASLARRGGGNYEKSSRVRVARVTLSGVTETSVAEHV
ncbi:Cannabinoid receptor type 1B [Merluccius polli]|uniref:Cannabinoid receptor type 1B n=1 Tax=Merluccius polli TaxID=89951 RepID=A0AA47PBH9_MERPO|nr:Cannabinoid receptor type 1B [Merluccius polli]